MLSKLTAQYPNKDNSIGINYPLVVEETVNQRLKILMRELNLNVASFANALGIKDSTLRNYFEEGRQSKPGYEFFERLNLSFGTVNMSWLFGGEGPPLLPSAIDASGAVSNNKKISRSLVVGNQLGGTATQNLGNDAAKDLLIEQLRSQLADKERTIQILLNQLPKP